MEDKSGLLISKTGLPISVSPSRARDTYYRERNRSRQNKGSESGFNFLKKPYPIFFKITPHFLYFWGPFLKKNSPKLLSIVIGEFFLPKVMRITDPRRCALATPFDAHQRPPEMRITFPRSSRRGEIAAFCAENGAYAKTVGSMCGQQGRSKGSWTASSKTEIAKGTEVKLAYRLRRTPARMLKSVFYMVGRSLL